MKNYIKIIAPILLGFFFIYLTFEITTPEERALIWSYIKSAKICLLYTSDAADE